MTIIKQSLLLAILCLLPFILLAQNNSAGEPAHIHSAEDKDLQWVPCPDFMPESCRISVLQGNPENPNADVFFKLQGNTSVPEHTHTSAERMILISGKLEVNYEGQQPEVMTEGVYGYGPPEKKHSASCVSEEPCILFIAFEEPVDAFPTRRKRN